MAKQKGIIQLTGTIDGINFYTRNGKPVARKAGGGFTGVKIKKSPTMVRVRENNTEFGHCSRFKKSFKDALLPFFKGYKDGELHGKMMQLFLALKDCDVFSERGKRTIEKGLLSTTGSKLLLDFNFTSFSLPLLKGNYDATSSFFTLQPFAVSLLQFPNGATHLVIDYGVVVFDESLSQATLHKSSTSVLLSKASVFDGVHFTVASNFSLSKIRFGILSYCFVQELNGVFYPLKDKSSFGLQVVGISL